MVGRLSVAAAPSPSPAQLQQMAVPRLLLRVVPPSSSSLLLANCKPSPLPVLNIGSSSRWVSTAAAQRAPPSETAIDDFWRWLCERGAVAASSASTVRPGFVPEGMGLVAQRDIPRNEVVVEVPKRLWIDSDTVVASEIGRLCAGLKPWVSIALFLLRERALGTASPWHPYLDILPPTTNSTIFWTEEELSEIEGEVNVLYWKLLENSSLTWIKISVSGPSLNDHHITLSSLSEQSVCINTSSLPTHAYHDKYTQVYIQYDIAKSNADLALDYGFVEQRPDRDAYTFTLEISESDTFYGDKIDIAESNGLDETAYFDIALGCPLPPLMLPYLRLVVLGGTDAFLVESVFRNTIWGHLELPVSRANEEAICRVIRQACKSAISAYHTTIEEVTSTRTARYRAVPPKIDRRQSISAVGRPIEEEIDHRRSIEEEKGRRRGKEEKKKRRRKNTSLARHRCPRVAYARGRFSPARGDGVSPPCGCNTQDEKLEGDNLDERLRIAICVRDGEKKVLQQIDDAFRERESELDILEYYQERKLKDLGLVGEQGDIIFWESK
ncbi:hypothetical protein BHE74_00032771 [Ensete ventricosum]|nr:hypothetical protein BHE74_00032771 [Ensete ventricosum]